MRWTEEQKDTVRELYGTLSTTDIADLIGKTKLAVKSFVRRERLSMSDDNRRKLQSLAMQKISDDGTFAGDKNPNWKGGISKNHYHYKKLQQERYPARVRARKILADHVKRGNIKRMSCEVSFCNETETDGHHEDYSKPLDVIWLCKKHHNELHKGQQ